MVMQLAKQIQVTERSSVFHLHNTSDFEIINSIKNNTSPQTIYQQIVETVCTLPGIFSAALLLNSEIYKGLFDLVAVSGPFTFEPDKESLVLNKLGHSTPKKKREFNDAVNIYTNVEIICLGASIGTLVVISEDLISKQTKDELEVFANHISTVFKRQQIIDTLQHFDDRLEVINELNQLIVSNAGLQRITKIVAREAAFRFGADVAIAFISKSTRSMLESLGEYGCSTISLPQGIFIDSGILGNIFMSGRHFSCDDISSLSFRDLDFLREGGITSINVCPLKVRNSSLGVLLLGSKQKQLFLKNDILRLEEFCYAAAVAISNAQTQDHIRSYSEQLERLVESRTTELAYQSARAESATHAKSQFLANMSHELKTPLTAIVGFTSVLVMDMFGPLNEKQKAALKTVDRACEHLKTVISDVLFLARLESGADDPEPTALSVRDILQQAYKNIKECADEKEVILLPFDLDSIPNDLSVVIDEKHVQQILINLLSNAVKYTPKGNRIWVEVSSVVDKVKISICDEGNGISEERIPTLFEQSVLEEVSYSRRHQGVGIGLNLTKRLIDLNGAFIGVDSVEGKGSTFWILVPKSAIEGKKNIAIEAQDFGQRLDGLSVVIVDDSPDTCAVLKGILSAAGASIRTAHNVKGAIELLHEDLPDILLTDLAMPGENGLSLVEYIRRNQSSQVSAIPIMMLSASASSSDRKAISQSGASLFVSKPFEPQEIVYGVRKLTLHVALTE